MKWIAVLALSLVLATASLAAGPDDQYLDIYNEILQADSLKAGGNSRDAAAKYLDAQALLKNLKKENPTWNASVVDFRLDYLADQLHALAPFLQAAAPAPAPAPMPKPGATVPATPSEVANLQEQIRSLTAANAQLENKLKEALSVQPAALSPQELAKAQDKIAALQKENDLLNVALAQSKSAKPPPDAERTEKQLADMRTDLKASRAEVDRLKNSLADAQKQIQSEAGEIDSLKAAAVASSSVKKIEAERDKLKEELAARTRDLADAEARREPGAAELREKLAKVERERDDLKAKLATARAPSESSPEMEQLRARLAVLEAQAVPYTPEELALLNKTPATVHEPLPAPAAPAPEKKHAQHSPKELPPGVGALFVDAQRAARARDFTTAEEKFKDILRQDENNVYVLAFLADTQFDLDKTNDCEKTLHRALALDPEDPASLYVLGVLRYRQNRMDEALDAITKSTKYNPTNALSQNYLGLILADKGQRAAAETAFRKALACQPDYVDAHYHLAIMYASAKPPMIALARFHYKKAVDLGHEKNPELEKVIGSAQ